MSGIELQALFSLYLDTTKWHCGSSAR